MKTWVELQLRIYTGQRFRTKDTPRSRSERPDRLEIIAASPGQGRPNAPELSSSLATAATSSQSRPQTSMGSPNLPPLYVPLTSRDARPKGRVTKDVVNETLEKTQGLANLLLEYPDIVISSNSLRNVVTILKDKGVSDERAKEVSKLGSEWKSQLTKISTSQVFQTMRNRVEFMRYLQSTKGDRETLRKIAEAMAKYFRNYAQKKQPYEVAVQDRDRFDFIILIEKFWSGIPQLMSVDDWVTFVGVKSRMGLLVGQEWYLHNTEQLGPKVQTLLEELMTAAGRSALKGVAEKMKKEKPSAKFDQVMKFVEGFQHIPQSRPSPPQRTLRRNQARPSDEQDRHNDDRPKSKKGQRKV